MRKMALSLTMLMTSAAFADTTTPDQISTQAAADVGALAQQIIQQDFQNNFQIQDVVQVAKQAQQLLSKYPHMTLDQLRSTIVQVVSTVVDELGSKFIPEFLLDPIVKAILNPLVHALIPDPDPSQTLTPIAGQPSSDDLSQFIDQMIQSTGSTLHPVHLPANIVTIVAQCNRYTDLTDDQKCTCATTMYADFLQKTDTFLMPDFLIDPILDKLGNALIQELL